MLATTHTVSLLVHTLQVPRSWRRGATGRSRAVVLLLAGLGAFHMPWRVPIRAAGDR